MNDTFLEIGIADLRKYFPIKVSDNLSDDFFISDIHYTEDLKALCHPCRFDGFMAVFCVQGHFRIEINLSSYEVRSGTLFMYVPGNIVRVTDVNTDKVEDSHFIVIAMSKEFLTSARIDMSRLFEEALAVVKDPCVRLTEDELQMFKHYLTLIFLLSSNEAPGMRDAISALLSSSFYYFGSIWKERIDQAARQESKNTGTRSMLVFEEFIRLVNEFHTQERRMSFYADKLCLTPKYLSKIIKQASGRSGPEWIDSYVILEAKNLLRYSDISIKEIVYRLHFPNSSVFYKFFKSKTGMTPSEYRK